MVIFIVFLQNTNCYLVISIVFAYDILIKSIRMALILEKVRNRRLKLCSRWVG